MKKLLSILLTISIVFSLATTVCAAENIENKNLQTFAQQWINQHYDNKTEVDEIIPVINGYDAVIGYSISFVSNGNPAGYVVLDFDDEFESNPISEYCFEGEDIYSILHKTAAKKYGTENKKTIVAKNSAQNYFITMLLK